MFNSLLLKADPHVNAYFETHRQNIGTETMNVSLWPLKKWTWGTRQGVGDDDWRRLPPDKAVSLENTRLTYNSGAYRTRKNFCTLFLGSQPLNGLQCYWEIDVNIDPSKW